MDNGTHGSGKCRLLHINLAYGIRIHLAIPQNSMYVGDTSDTSCGVYLRVMLMNSYSPRATTIKYVSHLLAGKIWFSS